MEDEAVKEALSNAIDKSNAHKITYQELKDLRDNAQLIPGSLYRITDYQCTTTQENTQSAGHQFDIVLLALSSNKLAEEGWAMMNESNVYDVTFDDGVTKKCWIYPNRDDEGYDIAVVGEELTKGIGALYIGDSFDDADLILNQEDKSALCSQPSSLLTDVENISYNYFQNSNLSAWKVWYCLDNDTSRFAWADDTSEQQIRDYEEDVWFVRDPSKDYFDGKFAWFNSDVEVLIYTDTPNPKVGGIIYDDHNQLYTGNLITAIKGFGRGVIYRLIDEWGNDCPYDFKNIQKYEHIVDGDYSPNNPAYTWVYTFCLYDQDNDIYLDHSLKIIEVSRNDTYVYAINNKIIPQYYSSTSKRKISKNIFTDYFSIENEETGQVSQNNIIIGGDDAIIATNNAVIIGYTYPNVFIDNDNRGVYIYGKKVLTEE